MELKKNPKSCQKSLGIFVLLATVSWGPQLNAGASGYFPSFCLCLLSSRIEWLPALQLSACKHERCSCSFGLAQKILSQKSATGVLFTSDCICTIYAESAYILHVTLALLFENPKLFYLCSQNLLILPSGIDRCHLALVVCFAAKVVQPQCRTRVAHACYSPGTWL